MKRTQTIIGREKKKAPTKKDKIKPQKKEDPSSLKGIAGLIEYEIACVMPNTKGFAEAMLIEEAWLVDDQGDGLPYFLKRLAGILCNIPRENLHGTRLGDLREQFLNKVLEEEKERTTIKD